MNKIRPLRKGRPGFFSAGQGGGEGRRGRRNRPARRRQKKRDAGREWRAAAARRHRTKKTHNGRPDAGRGRASCQLPAFPRTRKPSAARRRGEAPENLARRWRKRPSDDCPPPRGSAPGHPARRWVKETSYNPARRRADLPFLAFRKKNLNFFQKTVDKPLCRW